MPPEGPAPLFEGVVSRREARLVFWLVLLSLVGVIFYLWKEDNERPPRGPRGGLRWCEQVWAAGMAASG